MGVLQQVCTRFAKLTLGRVMVMPAIDANHNPDGFLLSGYPIRLFHEMDGWVVRLLNCSNVQLFDCFNVQLPGSFFIILLIHLNIHGFTHLSIHAFKHSRIYSFSPFPFLPCFFYQNHKHRKVIAVSSLKRVAHKRAIGISFVASILVY